MADPKPEPTVVPISTAVMQPDAQPHASQQAVTLNDIRAGHKGGRGVPITQIYAVQSEYAIYQVGEVSVHFAEQSKEQAQRKLYLQSVRLGEVNALVQGLVRREICDRQIAYALQLALDGDGDGAKATVATAKTLVLPRRAARGRSQLAAIAVSDENQTFEPCFPEPAVSWRLRHATGLLIIFSEIYLLARA